MVAWAHSKKWKYIHVGISNRCKCGDVTFGGPLWVGAC